MREYFAPYEILNIEPGRVKKPADKTAKEDIHRFLRRQNSACKIQFSLTCVSFKWDYRSTSLHTIKNLLGRSDWKRAISNTQTISDYHYWRLFKRRLTGSHWAILFRLSRHHRAGFHRRNSGVAHCRIEALQHVTGDLVTSLDGDDRFLRQNSKRKLPLFKVILKHKSLFRTCIISMSLGSASANGPKTQSHPSAIIFCQTLAGFSKAKSLSSELADYQAWRQIGSTM